MKLKQLVFGAVGAALLATAVPAAANAQLWYNGQFNGANGLTSERNTSVTQSMTYDNFVVTGSGWTINSLFGEFLSDVDWTTVDYEIRSGVSDGNGGSLLFSGVAVGASHVATGRSGFGYTEYRATVSGLNIFLGAGTYWLGISPVGFGGDDNFTRAYASLTSGVGGSNANIDGMSFINSLEFGLNFQPTSGQLGAPGNFAYGVDGVLGDVGPGTNGVVPEPASMTLLATGLAGLAANRRRKKTTA